MRKLLTVALLLLTQLSATTYEYDALNRLKTATYANGVVYAYSYDDAGNLLSVETTGIADPTDTDHDGIPDATESDLGLDPTKADTDGDGYSDLEEVGDMNHPRDTDHDGTIDALDTDSDNDGVSDADEKKYGFDPLVDDSFEDADNDGISNIDEIVAGTNPIVADNKISKKWIGTYSWSCRMSGHTEMVLYLSQRNNTNLIEGNVTMFGETIDINGHRVSHVTFDENGEINSSRADKHGDYLRIYYESGDKIVNNYLTLRLQDDMLVGTSLNGDGAYDEVGGQSSNGCSEGIGYAGTIRLSDASTLDQATLKLKPIPDIYLPADSAGQTITLEANCSVATPLEYNATSMDPYVVVVDEIVDNNITLIPASELEANTTVTVSVVTHGMRAEGNITVYIVPDGDTDDRNDSNGTEDEGNVTGVDNPTGDTNASEDNNNSTVGGGCTYNPHSRGFDLMMLLMLLGSVIYPFRRRFAGR